MLIPTQELIDYAEEKLKGLEFAIKQTAFVDVREGLKKERELVLMALRVLKLPTN